NALLFPLDNTGFRFSLGAQLCTLGEALCAGAAFVNDFGINPKLDVVDGSYPPMGLSPKGFKVGFDLNPIRLVELFTGKKETPYRPAERTEDKPAAQPVTNGVPAQPGDKAAVVAAPPVLTGVALFEAKRDENKKYADTAKKSADQAKD